MAGIPLGDDPGFSETADYVGEARVAEIGQSFGGDCIQVGHVRVLRERR